MSGLYTSVIITTGSGIVLFKDNGQSTGNATGAANPSAYNKSINLINQMITDNYVNFNPNAGKAAHNSNRPDSIVQTYSRNNEIIKYIDLGKKSIFITVHYSSLSAKASEVNKITKFLIHSKDLFSKLIIEEIGGGGDNEFTSFDFIKAKQTIKEKKFGLYLNELVKKVETDDINVNTDEDSSDDEEETKVEEKEADKTSQKVKQIKKGKQQPIQSTGKKLKSVKVTKTKKSRRWTDNGELVEDNSNYESLDFTEQQPEGDKYEEFDDDVSKLVSSQNYGSNTKSGFIINDLSKEIDDILSSSSKSNSKNLDKQSGGTFDFLKKYIGGKTITEQDLQKSSKIIKENLIRKNVSAEIADKLVSSLQPTLLGSKTKNFQSIESQIKATLQTELTKILTPNTSINLLQEIYKKQATAAKKGTKEPYVISIVGVNGVGKSTNLSKLAYWLLNNKFNVLIAACDTFRSGAVEQLKVHERNLNKLISSLKLESKLKVFEQGYGNLSKVSLIAKNSIEYAKAEGYDIILMDTAGRRHNDSKLMAPLKDFAIAAKPDKIIMVGEALVGTDSVMQASNFNKSFAGANRKLDFFIISKCDTVGDLIGTMVNMVYSTGIPILFVGVGQTYTDLRTLSVEWAVNTLLS